MLASRGKQRALSLLTSARETRTARRRRRCVVVGQQREQDQCARCTTTNGCFETRRPVESSRYRGSHAEGVRMCRALRHPPRSSNQGVEENILVNPNPCTASEKTRVLGCMFVSFWFINNADAWFSPCTTNTCNSALPPPFVWPHPIHRILRSFT